MDELTALMRQFTQFITKVITMRLIILSILAVAALASNNAATNATNGHKYAKVKGLERQCEQLLDGVFVYDDARQTYFCRVGRGEYVAMLHTTKVGE